MFSIRPWLPWLCPPRVPGRANRRRLAAECLEPRVLLTAAPYGALPDDTGEFMLGLVDVTVVLMESNTSLSPVNNNSETWSWTAIESVKSKIEEGLQWWRTTLGQMADENLLRFHIDYTYADRPVATSYEPIINPSTAFSSWIYDFLGPAGFSQTGDFSRDIRAFNHAQRQKNGADWAFTIFVVNDEHDADGKFAPGGFDRAFAYAGGRFFVTLASRPASTIAHETGHMFWALDEYPGGGTYASSRGYYNTANTNAWDNPAFADPASGQVQQPSIMASGGNPGDLLYRAYVAHTSSQSSLEMIGWRDTDADGIFDVLDVPHTLSGSGYYDAAQGLYRFFGESSVQTLPNRNPWGLQNDITINRISRAQYRIDGGAWETAAVYGTYQAALDLSIPMPAGAQQIEIRTIDDATGVTSPVFCGSTSRPSSTADPGISGFVWNDADADGTWDSGERGLSGALVRLVDAAGEVLGLRKTVEPDAYASDATLLTHVVAGATLSAVEWGSVTYSVRSVATSLAAAGSRVFGTANGSVLREEWTQETRTLRVDFATPVTTVSIDAIGNSDGDYARLEAYSASGELLARYTTQALARGAKETMRVDRPSADIAYVIARGHADSTVLLDKLQFGPETSAVTDPQGRYGLGNLEPGEYRVEVVLGGALASTSPAGGRQTVRLEANGQALTDIDFGATSLASPWQNPSNPCDVNANGTVSPLDVLLLINDLNRNGPRTLSPSDTAPPYLDVSGDGRVTALDALLVINAINRSAGSGAKAIAASAAPASPAPGAGEGELPASVAGVPSGSGSDASRPQSPELPGGQIVGALLSPGGALAAKAKCWSGQGARSGLPRWLDDGHFGPAAAGVGSSAGDTRPVPPAGIADTRPSHSKDRRLVFEDDSSFSGMDGHLDAALAEVARDVAAHWFPRTPALPAAC